jgi:hypothetical protein
VHALHNVLTIVTAPRPWAPLAAGDDRRPWFGDVVLVLFLCMQLLDGVLTYLGVAVSGVSEGNPLIARAMDQIGVGPGLTVAKIVAVASAAVLHLLQFHWLLAGLTALYLVLAVLPWAFILVLLH